MAQQHAEKNKVALLKLFTLIPLRSTPALIERKWMRAKNKKNKKQTMGCNAANVKVVFSLGPTEDILCELVQ